VTLFEQEMESQPGAVARFLESQTPSARRLASALREADVGWVMIAARGSSDNAARYGQYLLGARCRVPVALAAPSLFTVYSSPLRLRDALVVGISQSGEAPDVLAVLEEAGRQGCLTLAITSDCRSPLGRAGRHVLELGVREHAVAATMTYTTSLAALALLAACWEGSENAVAALDRMPQAMTEALTGARAQAAAARRLPLDAKWVVLGRGFAYSVAFEIALKLKEVAGVAVEPYSSADFMHGPIAAVDEGTVAVLVAPEGPTQPALEQLARELMERGASIVAISDSRALVDSAAVGFAIPPAPEWLSPLAAVVPGQVLALETALARGLDPDLPRGLSKITRTV
jgi:glucosamine--fructose-6-phosphate aminotransferase (isomerizing)